MQFDDKMENANSIDIPIACTWRADIESFEQFTSQADNVDLLSTIRVN
jgi:hypothetical protein